MIIEGYDLASNTGVASVDTAESAAPVWAWERWEVGGQRMDPLALVLFEAQLRERFRARTPDLVVWEDVQFVSYRLAYRTHCWLTGILLLVCEKLGIATMGVPVGTLKKWATDDGNAKKADMVRAARERLFGAVIPGAMPNEISEDEVDALWLVAYAAEQRTEVFVP